MNESNDINPEATQARIEERLGRLMRAAGFDVIRMLIMQHPVDTGYSRSQWRASVNNIDTTVDNPPTSDERSKSQGRKGWYPLKTPEIEEVGGDDVIYITNSVNYVRNLEEGSSKQAPAHFIKGIAQAVGERFGRYIEEAK